MSAQPTVGTLAAKAIELNANLTQGMARLLIRTENIRSLSKLEAKITELAEKTPDELKAMLPVSEEDEAKAKEAAKTTSKPAAAKTAAKTAPESKGTKTKTSAKGDGTQERKGREKKATTIVNEGPRGFRFGAVWNNSVLSQTGIAILPAHRNKLLKQAESLGLGGKFTAEDDGVKIAKAIAPKLQKQIDAQGGDQNTAS